MIRWLAPRRKSGSILEGIPLTFREAYNLMLSGKAVRRHGWSGYWYLDPVSGKLTICLADGSRITSGDFGLSVQNTLADDWECVVDRKED